MVAGLEHVGEGGRGQAGADRQPAAQALGHGHRVGAHAGALPAPPVAGAAHAALDLVEDEHRAVLVAGLARRRQRGVGERVDAALALDRLDQHRGGAAVDGRGQRPRRRRGARP